MSLSRPRRLFRFLTSSFHYLLTGTPLPTSSGRRRGRRARPVLALEALEDRTLMSVTGSALGVAGAFNVFVLGQLTQSYTDSEGRVAAGGNVSLTGYGIGSALSNSAGQRDDLVVGGQLTYNQGQVFNGNIVSGGTALLQNVGLPNGTARQGTPVDFAAARTQLGALSAAYAALASNGTTADTYGTIRLTGADPTLDVFSLSAAELASANGLNITAPAGATVLVNVSGTADQMQYFGMTVSGTDKQHVLFNFPNATSLTLAGISVQGSVLAPGADVTFNNGNLEGTLVAGSLTGSGEFHNFPTLAQITVQVPAPAPAPTLAPDVTVTKTTSTPVVNAGGQASFTVTVANTGPGTATGVTFADALPAGLGNDIVWSVASQSTAGAFSVGGSGPGGQSLLFSPTTLAPGASYSVTVTGRTTFADVSAGTFTGTLANTATVSAANEATSLQNQHASATVSVVAPDVTVTKTADQVSVTAGQSAGFTVTIKNSGAGTAAGVTLSDPLPAGPGQDINWVIDTGKGNPSDFAVTGAVGHQTLTLSGSFLSTLGDTLAAGQSIAVHITGVTTAKDATAAAPGLLLNTATVSAANEAPSLQNQHASATITVQAARPVQAGDFATIGFWQNQNGQALIRQLNGGSGATALGNWLAANFPHLFGASVDPSNALERNLTNATNATVASYFVTLFGAQGLDKSYAQVMAVALGAYATSNTLAGGTYGKAYRFNVSAGGSDADVVNVGANGSALGLPNNQTQTVLALLRATDQAAANKTLKANLSAVNTIFSGINQTGDIL
jgi:choice-of-anchor A domain-containing protein/uncharacterized repeat protein (TIGR01451 family)